MRFNQFLTESVNTHLYHIEEDIIRNGLVGAKSAVRYLFGLVDMLEGNAQADVRATVKWDGAPAIICGKNPENGKFFVGTKSVFNKNPKINYSTGDIRKNHSGDLANKLSICLRELSKLRMNTILQGDLLFTSTDLKRTSIDGEDMFTFTPSPKEKSVILSL